MTYRYFVFIGLFLILTSCSEFEYYSPYKNSSYSRSTWSSTTCEQVAHSNLSAFYYNIRLDFTTSAATMLMNVYGNSNCSGEVYARVNINIDLLNSGDFSDPSGGVTEPPSAIQDDTEYILETGARIGAVEAEILNNDLQVIAESLRICDESDWRDKITLNGKDCDQFEGGNPYPTVPDRGTRNDNFQIAVDKFTKVLYISSFGCFDDPSSNDCFIIEEPDSFRFINGEN